MNELIRYDQDFAEQVTALEAAILKHHEELSSRVTPRDRVKKRPDGFEYVDEGYLRELLNRSFPLWGWTQAAEPIVIPPSGAEWIIVSGTLWIIERGVKRDFYSPGAARVQFKNCSCKRPGKGFNPNCKVCGGSGKLPHLPENLIDLDKVVASANTNAFKRAVNRLCNIADDVYKKTMSEQLSDETQAEFEKLFKKAPADIRLRYEKFLANSGGLDNASEELVRSWIDGLKRKIAIGEDNGSLRQPAAKKAKME